MKLVLKPSLNRIKNGFCASSPELRIAAHGFSPETARINLERTALLLLKPFERQGSLHEELAKVPLDVDLSEGNLEVHALE